MNAVSLGSVSIAVTESVHSLGVTIDSTLLFKKHINEVCKGANYHLRALRHIRKCLSTEDAKQIAVSLVSAWLDYCNSLLYKTSQSNVAQLQRLQNSLARVVTGTRKRDHITPILADLHWLPVAARIDYKIALLTFKTFVSRQPSYLHELIHIRQPARSLRSSTQVNRLHVNIAPTSFGSRAFSHASPAVWNILPEELTNDLSSITTFKRGLKTHMYRLAFNH